MRYYRLDYVGLFDTKEQVLGDANGEFVPNARYYFEKIGNGEIIYDAPVFDYFHLQGFGPKEDWEWKLQDVHGFIGEYPPGGYWYISDKCKRVFENVNIAIGYHFYPTILLYKGERLCYWIFQFAANDKGLDHTLYIDYPKSVFFDEQRGAVLKVSDYNEFKVIRDRIGEETDYEKDLIAKKTVLNQAVDFIPFFGINSNDLVASERLKLAIEEANLDGFKFLELEHEVVLADETL